MCPDELILALGIYGQTKPSRIAHDPQGKAGDVLAAI
jgi:hypothetical protein